MNQRAKSVLRRGGESGACGAWRGGVTRASVDLSTGTEMHACGIDLARFTSARTAMTHWVRVARADAATLSSAALLDPELSDSSAINSKPIESMSVAPTRLQCGQYAGVI